MNEHSSAASVVRRPEPKQVAAQDAPSPPSDWPAVVSVALVSFVLVLSEFLPIGLLPVIGSSLHVSVGTVGLVVVVPGLMAAVTAPLLTIASGRLDRRKVLLALALFIAASNVLAALAPNMPVMAAARILLGVGVGGFWAMGAGAAARLVPAQAVHRASSLITAGISAGTVVSLPLGALVGHLAGWRTAFVVTAGAALLALAALALRLPSLPPTGAIRTATLTGTLRNPAARIALLATALIFFGHFAAYTYITPYLEEQAHFGSSVVTLVLLGYGMAGLAGNFAAGAVIGRSLRTVYITAALLVTAAVGLLNTLTDVAPAVIVLVMIWGAAFGAVPLALQTWILRATPEAPESGMALLVSACQIALASGSLIGGMVVDGYGTTAGFALGGTLALLSAVTQIRPRLPRR
ncbi:MFS transporter [Streptomyces mirabilis]|uniref:MFS transporter n=1 Tax=Streptomyces mirabilis TaxID=68239 RepID=UPI0037911DAF